MFTWKNTKNYYKKYLQRVVLYNCLIINKFTTIPIRLSVDKRSKKTHLLYLTLLSNRKKVHFIRFNSSKKHKKQVKHRISIKNYCRITNGKTWKIIRKLFDLTQKASQILLKEERVLKLKSNLAKLTFWNTNKTNIANRLKSKRRYYVNTPITLNILLKDKQYITKWFFLNVIRMISKSPEYYDIKYFSGDKEIIRLKQIYVDNLEKNKQEIIENNVDFNNFSSYSDDSDILNINKKDSLDDNWLISN